MKLHLFKFIILFTLISVGIALVGGYYNLIPEVSQAIKTNQAKDLGIYYDKQTVTTLLEKTNIITAKETTDELKLVDITLNSQEVTAWVQENGSKLAPLKNVQIKINNNKTIEMSAIALTDKLGEWISGSSFKVDFIKNIKQMPVYAKGEINIEKNKVSLSINKVTFANIPVPNKILNKQKDTIENFLQSKLENIQGMYVEKLEVQDGKLHFVGRLPN